VADQVPLVAAVEAQAFAVVAAEAVPGTSPMAATTAGTTTRHANDFMAIPWWSDWVDQESEVAAVRCVSAKV
jgi:hypothetical protein